MITYELIIEGDMIYNFSVYPLDVLEWSPYNVDCSEGLEWTSWPVIFTPHLMMLST